MVFYLPADVNLLFPFQQQRLPLLHIINQENETSKIHNFMKYIFF